MPTPDKKNRPRPVSAREMLKILDGIVDPFYIINIKDYTVALANKAARDFGWSPDCTCFALTHKAARPCTHNQLTCPVQIIKKTRQPVTVEHRHYDQHGHPRYFEVNGYPLFDENGELTQIIEHTIDITSRKLIEQAVQESEKRYRDLYQGSRDGYVLVDINGRIKECNRAFEQMLGFSHEELRHLWFRELSPPRGANREKALIQEQVLARGYSEIYERDFRHKSGRLIPAELRTSLIRDNDGNPLGMWSFVRDISEPKKARQELARLQKNLQIEKRKLEHILTIDRKMSGILNLNHLVDFVIEQATQVLEVERCSLMLVDAHSQELIIRGARGLDHRWISSTRIKIGEQIAGRVAERGRAILVNDIEENPSTLRKNRPGYKSKAFMSVPITLQSKLVGVVNVADKINKADPNFTRTDLRILNTIVRQAAIAIENANYYRELKYLSISDPLTGIYNYRHFVRTLEAEIDRANRYDNPLCLFMLDIDDFKAYNDAFGHLEGDLLLKEISRVLKENLRVVDILCRYAGDEFVAILPETPLARGALVAQKIQEAVGQIQAKSPVSVSIGVCQHRANGDRRDMLLKADQALYQAKRGGKGRVQSCPNTNAPPPRDNHPPIPTSLDDKKG